MNAFFPGAFSPKGSARRVFGSSSASSGPPAYVPEFPLVEGTLKIHIEGDSVTGVLEGASFSPWPDLSSSGNSPAQATAGYRPVWNDNYLNGNPVVTFDGTDDRMSVVYNSAVSGSDYLLAGVMRCTTSFSTQRVLIDSSDNLFAALYNPTNNTTLQFYNGAILGPGTFDATSWKYIEARINGASSTLRVNGTVVASGTAAGSNMNGITLAAAGDTSQKSSLQLAMCVVIAAPTPTDISDLREYALVKYGLAAAPGTVVNIVCAGNSNTKFIGSASDSWPSKLQTLLNTSYPNCYVNNQGVDGRTTAQMVSAGATYDALLTSGITNVLIVNETRNNEVLSGVSPATDSASLDTFIAARYTAGWDLVIEISALPSTGWNETDFEASVALRRAGSGADAFIDLETDQPSVAAWGAQSGAYYQVDQVHINASATTIVAAAVHTVLVPLLP